MRRGTARFSMIKIAEIMGLSGGAHRADYLVRHSLLLLAASQATNIANMLFHFCLGRMLSPVEYGSLVSMLGLLLVFGTPLNALGNAMAFHSARLLADGHPGAILPFTQRWTRNTGLAAVALFLLGLALCPAATGFFKLQRYMTFLLAAAVMSLALFGPVLGGILQGIQAFGWASLAGVASGVARIVFSVLLVHFLGRISDWALVGHGIGILASIVICVWGVMLLFGKYEREQVARGVTAFFSGSLVALAGFSVLMNADVLIVKHFFLPEESGLFARASTIGRMIIFLPMPIAGALFPKIIAAGDIGNRQGKLLLRGVALAGLIIAGAAGLVSLFPGLLLWFMYNDLNPGAEMLRLVRYTIWAMTPLSLVFILMNYFMAREKFGVLVLLPLFAVFYLGGSALWHDSLFQILTVMGACNLMALTVLSVKLAIATSLAMTVRNARG